MYFNSFESPDFQGIGTIISTFDNLIFSPFPTNKSSLENEPDTRKHLNQTLYVLV